MLGEADGRLSSAGLTASMAATRILRLPEGAQYVAAYWIGNPHARVSLAFSRDGAHFDAPLDAARDEIGLQRSNGTTYGAIHDARGALAVRVVTDRSLARVTILGMSGGVLTANRTVAGVASRPGRQTVKHVNRAVRHASSIRSSRALGRSHSPAHTALCYRVLWKPRPVVNKPEGVGRNRRPPGSRVAETLASASGPQLLALGMCLIA
jgi:hypothetical protein